MTIEIPLTNTNKTTTIDKEDYEKVAHIPWYTNHDGYAVKNLYKGDYVWEGLILHRVIMDAGKGQIVDHIDRNKLNNSKSNLRFATIAENNRNEGLTVTNTSGYKGVYIRNGKFGARISNGKGSMERLGHYDNIEDAAKAYNVKAEEYFGEFAWLNDVDHTGFKIRDIPSHSSNYRGVHRVKDGRWMASIWNNSLKKKFNLGTFGSEVVAAEAYNEYAIHVLNDLSRVNEIIRERI